MATIVLDLTGLKCPLPVLRTAKALKALEMGGRLKVYCTDPLAVIDIPHLIQQTGDRIDIVARDDCKIVFLIEKVSADPARE